MNLRMAIMDDLPQLKVVFQEIIKNMDSNHLNIWDEIYPYEFFEDDIKDNRLYVLIENTEIVSAFALCNSNAGADSVKWKDNCATAFYIERFGVNVNYLRKGIGQLMLHKAVELSREMRANYVRLFVADINEPAINLYIKNGFKKGEGIYDEVIDDDLVLHELGFEIETSL